MVLELLAFRSELLRAFSCPNGHCLCYWLDRAASRTGAFRASGPDTVANLPRQSSTNRARYDKSMTHRNGVFVGSEEFFSHQLRGEIFPFNRQGGRIYLAPAKKRMGASGADRLNKRFQIAGWKQ